MVATWNPSADSSYYTTTAYYVGPAGAGHARWFAAAKAFGVSTGAPVDAATFTRLFSGLGADGQPLVAKAARNDRVPAFDVTLSAPRSVSVVWALAAPDLKAQIEEAQHRAAVATLAMLDKEAAFARRGKGGKALEQVSLTAAMIRHGDSRPARHEDGRVFADPNLHTHNVILNLARRVDGTAGAIHSSLVRDYKMAAGATYHVALACELQALGFSLDRLGKNGVFEIAGVTDPIIKYFSARRNEIRDKLAASGTTSAADPAQASSIAKISRRAKAPLQQGDCESVWRSAAEQLQIRTDVFSESLRGSSVEQQETKSESAIATRLAEAVKQLTETKSVVRRQDVIRCVASALVGTRCSAERIAGDVARLIAEGRVVQVGHDPIGLPLYSTPDLIAVERSVVEAASRLAKNRAFGLDARAVKKRCGRDRLSGEQADAVLSMTSGGGIAVVEGSAGAGKTTLLKTVVNSYTQEGYRVIGAAMAWQAANMLKQGLGIDARSTASLLARIGTGNLSLNERTVLVIDEAGLIGSRDMAALLETVEHADAKIILVGDRRQLQPVGAGPALGIVAGVVEARRVDAIVRQHERWARSAVADLRDGRAMEALDAFSTRGHVVEAEGPRAAIVAAVDAWQEAPAGEPKLLIAKTNLQVAALSHEVRARLRKTGELRGDDVALSAVTPSGHTHALALAVGDRIRFQIRNDTLKVVNGTTAVVTAIRARPVSADGEGRQVSIQAMIGDRKVTFQPDDLADAQGRPQLGYAYATTIYGSQGLTVDRATVLLDGSFDRHDAYVAASRARRETKLVVDGNDIDRQLKSDPLGMKQPPGLTTKDERLAWLANRLARENRKISTIEVIAAEKSRQAGARPSGRPMSKAARSKSTREHALEI